MDIRDDLETLAAVHETCESIRQQLSQVIVGQQRVVDELLIALLAQGHCLLVGVPGLAKTLLIRSLAEVLSFKFSRIQFTPDLMPSDVTGTEVIQEDQSTGQRALRFLPGPVFANVVLADEINRTPPKTQAALLEAMQEKQVSYGGTIHPLPEPFFVLATQNPIEHEGTYPLPEAQLDRFMLNIHVDYPAEDEELQIVNQTTSATTPQLTPLALGDRFPELLQVVRRIPVAEHVARYAIQLVRFTRTNEERAPEFVREYVRWGAGPRASQNLVLGGKARAALCGRKHVTIEDIRSIAAPVLRHRICTNFNADAEGISTDEVIDRLLQLVEVPTEKSDGAAVADVFRATPDR